MDGYWCWICVGALMGFSLLFNICFIVPLVYLDCKLFLVLSFRFSSLNVLVMELSSKSHNGFIYIRFWF